MRTNRLQTICGTIKRMLQKNNEGNATKIVQAMSTLLC